MVNGPPCSTCGNPLRWVVERNAWGCDRCRVVHDGAPTPPQVPTPVPGHPGSQMSVPAYGPARSGTLAGGSKSPFAVPKQPAAPAAPPYAAPNPYAGQNGSNPHAVPDPYGAQGGSNPYAAPNPYAAQQGGSNPYAAPNPYGAQGGSNPYAAPNPYAAQQAGSNPYAAQQSAPTPYTPQPYALPQVPQQAGHGPSQFPLGSAPGQHPPSHFAAAPAAAAAAAPASYIAQPRAMSAPIVVDKPRGGKKGLVIAIVLVLLAGAGIAIAVVMTRGGGGGDGISSRDELAKRTLAAISDRDADALLALAGPDDLLARHAECKPTEPAGDPEKARTDRRRELQKLVDEAKGSTAELVQITSDSKQTLEAGKELGPCKLTTAMATVTVKAKVTVAQSGKPAKEQDVEMTFTELAGSWYLAAPPRIRPPVDCARVAGKAMKASRDVLATMQVSESGAGRLEKRMLQHCTEHTWSVDVAECVSKADGDPDVSACLTKLPAGQRDELAKALAAIIAQEAKNAPVTANVPVAPKPEDTATGSGSGSAAGSGDPLPPEEAAADPDALPLTCKQYGEQVAKMQTCKQVPAGTRSGAKASFDAVKQSWSELPAKTAKLRESFEQTCKTNRDDIELLMKGCR